MDREKIIVVYRGDCILNHYSEIKKYFDGNKIEQFKKINNSEGKHIKHPILYLIEDSTKELNYNTEKAFAVLNNKDNNYFKSMKKKIENEKNFSNINGYLGEMRCYGSLLDAFTNNTLVSPIKTKKDNQTADFEVVNEKNQEKVYIEVNTKQCNDNESKRFKKNRDDIQKKIKENQQDNKNISKPKVAIYTSCIAPFGAGKNCIETNINVIQKIAQTKQGKNQIPKGEKGILWLDFQSEGIQGLLNLNQVQPLWYNKNYGMFSGLIWYALYGKKKLPIFSSTQFHDAYKGLGKLYKMEHDGLFLQRKDISAAIISSDKYTLYFENPFCKEKIPIWFLEGILNIPRFYYEYSIISFPTYNVKKEIKNRYKRIKDLSKIPNRSF